MERETLSIDWREVLTYEPSAENFFSAIDRGSRV
jgi:hypothetical protein